MDATQFEVKQEGDKIFGLYLDGALLGTSGNHCDCDFAREQILKAARKTIYRSIFTNNVNAPIVVDI